MRLTRIIGILNLLHSGRRLSAVQLADMFQCTKRTIFRDIALLKAANIQLHFNWENHTYAATPTDRRIATIFSLSEYRSLMHAIASSPLRKVDSIECHLETAIAKLLIGTKDCDRAEISSILNSPRAKLRREVASACDKLNAIIESVITKRPIRITYTSGSSGRAISKVAIPRKMCVAEFGSKIQVGITINGRATKLKLEDIVSVQPAAEPHSLQFA